MTGATVLVRRELRAAFSTPLLYLVGMPLLALSGWYLYSVLVGDRTSELRRYFWQLEFLLLLTVPLFSMRSIAEERRSGSLGSLLVRPVGEGAIVLAKAISVIVSILAVLAVPFGLFLAAVSRLGEPDTGAVAAQCLGTLFMLMLVTSIGIAWSSVTQSQILAAAGALATNIVLWIGTGLSESQLRLLSIQWHVDAANSGLIAASDVAYFFGWSAVLLLMARIGLMAARR